MGLVTRHTLPRDFGMHPVDMVWQIVLGESDPPASGAALRQSVGHSPWRKALICRYDLRQTRLLYSGNDLIGEYNVNGTMLDRYVHGVSAGDDPMIRYPGPNAEATSAEFLYSDRLGSVIASFGYDRSLKAINSYDEFGIPGAPSASANTGRVCFARASA